MVRISLEFTHHLSDYRLSIVWSTSLLTSSPARLSSCYQEKGSNRSHPDGKHPQSFRNSDVQFLGNSVVYPEDIT